VLGGYRPDEVINDTLAASRDALIASIGELIKEQVRDSDGVARLGSDEFGILLGNCSTEQSCGWRTNSASEPADGLRLQVNASMPV